MTWTVSHIDKETYDRLKEIYGGRSTTAIVEPIQGQEAKHNIVLVDSDEGYVVCHNPYINVCDGHS